PFLMKDPRYHGTFVSNGTFFRTEIITAQRGVILNNATINGNDYKQFFDTNPASSTYKQFNINPAKFNGGKATTYVVGTGNSANASDDNGSCWLKKWTDPVTDITLIHDYSSRTSWMDLRYGEVLLDFAEASFELGKPAAEQLSAINLLRARAGIPALATISRALIRHERLVELAYENKSWWDYSRWRALATDFSNRQEYTLQCYWDLDTNDYVYIKQNAGGTRTLSAQFYYADIPGTDASQNPLLVPSHNPGY
ncbi:RagB/SusD family nutrient uptake outer membrane protein, partial [Mucilaginibacter sp.]|uniref:RagB/SusD family nutrient uptake outer membrane protein n=1 Tax=Mucilaginibacter sp. TaxID=1882438 RepID=UPI00260A3CAE